MGTRSRDADRGRRRASAAPTRRGPARRGRAWAVMAVAATLLVASGCVEQVVVVNGSGPGGSTPNLAVSGGQDTSDESVVARHAGTVMSFGTVPDHATPAGDGEPIKIGMINQEGTPLGSFPELRLGALAA